MKYNIFRVLKYVLLLCLMIFLGKIFLPSTYTVPGLEKRENIQYWDLATGSHIAYTMIPSKGVKRPYPIIYLHGGPGGPITNKGIEILSSFAQDGYDIYLYDQIGGGYSARLDHIIDYTPERHKRDLEEIVKKLGAEKVILVGQSWGAMLAILFAADNSEKVEKIIFTGPGPIPPVNRSLAAIQAPDSLQLKLPTVTNAQGSQKVSSWRSNAVSFAARKFGVKLASDKEADSFATYMQQETNKSTVCDTSKAIDAVGGAGHYVQLMTIQSLDQVADPRPKLKNSTIPVLIMKGQCDNQKWGYTNEYLQLFSNHQFVLIPNAGHGIATEQPDIYLKTIRDFLNQ